MAKAQARQFGMASPDKLMSLEALSKLQADLLNTLGVRVGGSRVVSRTNLGGVDYYAPLNEVLGSLGNDTSVPVELEILLIDLSQNMTRDQQGSNYINAAQFAASFYAKVHLGDEPVNIAEAVAFLDTVFPNFDATRYIVNYMSWQATHPLTSPPVNAVPGSNVVA